MDSPVLVALTFAAHVASGPALYKVLVATHMACDSISTLSSGPRIVQHFLQPKLFPVCFLQMLSNSFCKQLKRHIADGSNDCFSSVLLFLISWLSFRFDKISRKLSEVEPSWRNRVFEVYPQTTFCLGTCLSATCSCHRGPTLLWA